MIPVGAGVALGGVANAAVFGRTCARNEHDATPAMIGGVVVGGLGIALTLAGGVKVAGAGPALRGAHRVSAGAKTGMVFLAVGSAVTSYALLTALQLYAFDACFST